jgi:hypothetical protein
MMKFFSSSFSHHLKQWLVALALLLTVRSAARAQAGDAEVTPKVQQLYAEANAAAQSGDEATAIE